MSRAFQLMLTSIAIMLLGAYMAFFAESTRLHGKGYAAMIAGLVFTVFSYRLWRQAGF